jgi:hypothetical protein
MKKSFADRLLGAVAVGSIVLSYAAPAVTVTFEGMVTPPATSISLTTQISGVTFLQEERFLAEVHVVDPASIHNSSSLPLSAATSGTAAARTDGMAMRFATPVSHVGLSVSPGFLTMGGVSAFVRVDLIGYDVQLNERKRSTILLRAAAETVEEVRAFRPERIELNSEVPLACVALRFNLGAVYIDDLTFIAATPEQLRRRLPPPQRWAPGTFEGLVKPWEPSVAVSRIADGVSFRGELFVHDPAYLDNSRAIPLSAATSGNAAASTGGGEFRFTRPARRVETKISPGFISYNGVSTFGRVTLTGYDARNQVSARSSAQVRFSAERIDQIENFVPVKINLTSKIPLSRVTIQSDAGRFYIDDLKWKSLHDVTLRGAGLPPGLAGRGPRARQ